MWHLPSVLVGGVCWGTPLTVALSGTRCWSSTGPLRPEGLPSAFMGPARPLGCFPRVVPRLRFCRSPVRSSSSFVLGPLSCDGALRVDILTLGAFNPDAGRAEVVPVDTPGF